MLIDIAETKRHLVTGHFDAEPCATTCTFIQAQVLMLPAASHVGGAPRFPYVGNVRRTVSDTHDSLTSHWEIKVTSSGSILGAIL